MWRNKMADIAVNIRGTQRDIYLPVSLFAHVFVVYIEITFAIINEESSDADYVRFGFDDSSADVNVGCMDKHGRQVGVGTNGFLYKELFSRTICADKFSPSVRLHFDTLKSNHVTCMFLTIYTPGCSRFFLLQTK